MNLSVWETHTCLLSVNLNWMIKSVLPEFDYVHEMNDITLKTLENPPPLIPYPIFDHFNTILSQENH